MKARELINKVDAIQMNAFTDDQKLGWINELRAKIEKEVIETHHRRRERPKLYRIHTLDKKDDELGMQDEIDIEDAYLDVYEYWLYGKIDLANADYDRYSNDLVLFNNAYSDFKKWYNRNYMPLGVR